MSPKGTYYLSGPTSIPNTLQPSKWYRQWYIPSYRFTLPAPPFSDLTRRIKNFAATANTESEDVAQGFFAKRTMANQTVSASVSPRSATSALELVATPFAIVKSASSKVDRMEIKDKQLSAE